MLNLILRLYLRHGAKKTAKRLDREIGTIYDETDIPRYTGVAIDDFFYRTARFLSKYAPYDTTMILEEEKDRAKRKYASW